MSRRIVPQILLAAAVVALIAGCSPGAGTPGAGSSTPAATIPAATPTATPAAATVVLGSASNFGPSAKGFGQTQPDTIFFGGDPTGLVTNVTWTSWGAATGTGTGMAINAAHSTVASAPHETATVVASDLQTCGGVLMYTRLVWYFPQEGETYAKALAQFGSQATIAPCS